jgi:predicted AAA+ superfamily ATPase
MFDERLILEFENKLRDKVIREKIIERELKVEIMHDKAISIIGPRRAGKTYFLLWFFKGHLNNSIYLDFEDIVFKNVTGDDVLRIISIYENYYNIKIKNVLLDEIQNLIDWESLVRSLLNIGYNVLLTGSSSRFLSKEIATQLRGRSISYMLLPFSFREYLRAKNIKVDDYLSLSDEIRVKRALREYIEWGGYPEIVLQPSNRERLIKEYYYLVFYKDFVERFRIKSINTASFIFEFFLQNYSNEMSINKIINYIVSKSSIRTKTTIYDYVDKIQDTAFAFFLERYRGSIYERKSWPKKIYLCDPALSNLAGFDINIGKRMENLVFLELLRKANKNPLLRFYYLKTQNSEVDFIIMDGINIHQLIQVTYASNKNEVEKREIKSLIRASELLNCKNLVIITWDYEDEQTIENNKIKFIPLWKWLLTKDVTTTQT